MQINFPPPEYEKKIKNSFLQSHRQQKYLKETSSRVLLFAFSLFCLLFFCTETVM
jgi:hypothetical protein